MTIWHWIVLLVSLVVIGGAVVHIRKREREEDDLQHVRAWLALLVVGLMFLGPLIGAGRRNSDFLQAEAQYPQLLSAPQWTTYKTAAWVTFAVAALLSIFAGSRLAYTRRYAAVKWHGRTVDKRSSHLGADGHSAASHRVPNVRDWATGSGSPNQQRGGCDYLDSLPSEIEASEGALRRA